MTHVLKITDTYYSQILDGNKTFEVRYNDRGYQKGDLIEFKTEDSHGFRRDGRWKIIYVHSGLGMENMFVVLGIKRIDKSTQESV
jgi:ASC-1-like (ASCH) protein